MTKKVDMGNGHSYSFFMSGEDQIIAGIIEEHPAGKDCNGLKQGEPCFGSVFFDIPETPVNRPRWKVISLEPLTIEPSILCTFCGNHGYIRESKWISC